MARYYGGICINHTVLKRISSKKIFRTVVLQSGRGLGRGCKKPAQRQRQSDVRLGTPPPKTTNALPPPLQSGGGLGRGCKKPTQRQKQNDIRLGAPHPEPSSKQPPPPVGEGRGGVCPQTSKANNHRVLSSLLLPWQQTLTTIAKKTVHLLILTALTALPARAAEYLWLYDGERPIHAEVVYRDEDRARGLMYRPWLAPYSGMLFIFDPPQPVAFWMKNTLIPLEMRFYDAHGQRIARHLATPCTHAPCKHYPAHGQTAYVLETRARYRLVTPPQPLQILPALPE